MAWLVLALLILVFGFVVFFGAPYLPTKRTAAKDALDLLGLKPGQTFYDLGCGDGRLLKLAAQRGLRAVGYELNPLLAVIAKVVNWRYRHQVSIKWSNFWRADLSQADGVFVFLLDKYMPKLDKKLEAAGKPVRLATYAFKIPGKKPVAKKGAIFLYDYGQKA